jgi:hypothetical protein
MKQLSLWMKVVGALYVVNALLLVATYLIPAIGEASVEARVAGADPSNPLYAFALDTWLMFGLELLVVGVALWIASRAAWANRILAVTVIALELIRGIVDDLIWIASGYPSASYVGWILLHTAIILTGILVLRRAHAEQPERAPVLA